MLYFDIIDISKGTDVNKTNASKECIICDNQQNLYIGFKFQPNAWSGCRDVLMMSMNLDNIATLNILRLIIDLLSIELAKKKPFKILF